MECRISSLSHLNLMISQKSIWLVKNILLGKILPKCMVRLSNILFNQVLRENRLKCDFSKIIHILEHTYSENTHSATLRPKNALTPSNRQISPNCLSEYIQYQYINSTDIYSSIVGRIHPIQTYRFNLHIFPNYWQNISNTNI